MLIKTLPVGHLETNCYVVTDENTLECAVIDPGAEANTILDYLEDNRLRCTAVMLTHAHFDHIGALDEVLRETGAVFYVNKKEEGGQLHGPAFKAPEDTIYYSDGDEVRVPGMGNAGTNGSEAGDFVCRVCVPEERLTQRQANGCNLIGFALPFLAFGLLTGMLASFAVFIALLFLFGGYLVVRDGLRRSGRWWRNAGVAVLNGLSNGFFIALFLMMMFSCTAGLGTRGYMGPGVYYF